MAPATPESLPAGLDPAEAGWESESLTEQTGAVLKAMAKWIESSDRDPESIPERINTDFSGPGLRGASQHEVYSSATIRVRRSTGAPADEPRMGFSAQMEDFLLVQGDCDSVRAAFKTVRATVREHDSETMVLVEISGRSPDGMIQQNGTWICTWNRTPGGDPSLVRIRADDYEEVVTRSEDGPMFSDSTTAVLGANRSFGQQLAFGLNHWLKRIEMNHGLLYFVRNGLAVADVNGDGLDDVYLCSPAGLPNRLYLQDPDGSARDASAELGLDWLDETSSALFIDLDNDGDQDCAVATLEGLLVLEQVDDGTFARRALLKLQDVDVHSLSAVDFDNDGDLDLYLTVDFANPETILREGLPAFVYHDANDGGRNTLFRNEGGFGFNDVTAEVGLEVNNRRHSLAAAWEDYDNDGDQDLYIANDYGRNCLYRNEGGTFSELAPGLGVVDFGGGMAVAWGDYNRDGLMDLHVSNMYSAAGNRITRQAQFMPGADADKQGVYQRFSKGDSLFEQVSGGSFNEVGPQANIEMARWAWGSLFMDINNDGWEDLMVANGYVTGEDPGDL